MSEIYKYSEEQPLPPDFISQQYGHLPEAEKPKTGPVVDVREELKDNGSYLSVLEEKIRNKKIATRQWVENNFPEHTAVWLTRPFFWQNNPHLQELAANWMAQIILKVYGKGYPLPNKYPEVNLDGLRNGSLLPYFGLIVPVDSANDSNSFHINLANGNINPNTLIPVTTSAILLDSNGFAELGRNANRGYKDDRFRGFEGGPTTLERVYDWLRNRHRLLERVHTLTSDVRSAEAHRNSPSSGGVQTLILRDLGMKIVYTAPLYNVNGFEPFISVRKPRSLKDWRRINSNKTIYTPPGPHIPLLQTLWRHQLGVDINSATPQEETLQPHSLAIPRSHGDDIYALLDIYDAEREMTLGFDETRQLVSLEEAVNSLIHTAPIILAKVEAETPTSAATQQFLIENGFVVCGIEPGYDFQYLNGINDHLVVRKHKSPAYIYLARLGTVNPDEIAPPFFLDPVKTAGRNFGYDIKLQELLRKTHLRILDSKTI